VSACGTRQLGGLSQWVVCSPPNSVFAMALGIAAAALFRLGVPAILTTLGVFVAVRIVTALNFRPLFAVSKNVSPHSGSGYPPLARGLSSDILGPHREHVSYLPASRLRPVQGVESGIFLVLALALRSLRIGRSRPVRPSRSRFGERASHRGGRAAEGDRWAGAVTLHPKLVSLSSTTGSVVDCIYSTSELLYWATEKPVPPVTPPENNAVGRCIPGRRGSPQAFT
jgi:hypothetical protein